MVLTIWGTGEETVEHGGKTGDLAQETENL